MANSGGQANVLLYLMSQPEPIRTGPVKIQRTDIALPGPSSVDLGDLTRTEDISVGVMRFSLITASTIALSMLATELQRLWLGDTPDAQLPLGGPPLVLELQVFGCLGVAALAHYRRRGNAALTACAGLFVWLVVAGSLMHARMLTGTMQVGPRPSWNSIHVLLFTLLVAGPPLMHHALLLLVSFTTPVALAVMIVTGQNRGPHTPPQLAQRMVISVSSTWICALVGVALVVHRERERRRLRALTEQLVSARSQLRDLGSYTLERRLGSGGMGEVWQAAHRVLARPAAIKLVSAKFLLSQAGNPQNVERFLARFLQEAKVTARLTSPHTVQVYDYGRTDDGQLYYVMELLHGADLAQVVKVLGPQPPELVVHWLLQLCDSLAEAHSLGLVHRDLKPANLFLCRQGARQEVVKLLDFGLALTRRQRGTAEADLDDAGTISGSPHFMAPEQIRDDTEIDGRADLYAVGCVAWFLLTGRHVFEGLSHEEAVTAQTDRAPDPLATVAPVAIDPRLVAIIHRLLAKDPGQRPQSADELAENLAALGLPKPSGHVLTQELLGNDADYAAEQTLVMVKPRTAA